MMIMGIVGVMFLALVSMLVIRKRRRPHRPPSSIAPEEAIWALVRIYRHPWRRREIRKDLARRGLPLTPQELDESVSDLAAQRKVLVHPDQRNRAEVVEVLD